MKNTSKNIISVMAAISVMLISNSALAYKKNTPTHSTHSINYATSPHLWVKGGATFVAGGAGGGFSVGSDFSVYDMTRKGTFALRLGPQFSATFIGLASVLDFEAALRPSYTFNLPEGALMLYAQVPVGFSLGLAGAAVGPGLVFGIIPGLQYLFCDHFGIFVELGFLYHGNKYPAAAFLSVPSGTFNAGLSYVF